MLIDSTYVLFFLSTQALCLFGVFEPVLSGHMRGVAG